MRHERVAAKINFLKITGSKQGGQLLVEDTCGDKLVYKNFLWARCARFLSIPLPTPGQFLFYCEVLVCQLDPLVGLFL